MVRVNTMVFSDVCMCVCVFAENVESELLEMYSKTDTLMLCVRLAVLVAVTLTVPVVLFPVHTHLQTSHISRFFLSSVHLPYE